MHSNKGEKTHFVVKEKEIVMNGKNEEKKNSERNSRKMCE